MKTIVVTIISSSVVVRAVVDFGKRKEVKLFSSFLFITCDFELIYQISVKSGSV